MLDMFPPTFDFGLAAMEEDALPLAGKANFAKERGTEKESTKRLARCGKCENCTRKARACPPCPRAAPAGTSKHGCLNAAP